MIITFIMVASILFLALQLEEKFKVPSPLGLIALSFVAHYAIKQAPVITGDAESFAKLVIFLLPVLLISDSLEITRLKNPWFKLVIFVYRSRIIVHHHGAIHFRLVIR